MAASKPAVKPVRNEYCSPKDPWAETFEDGNSQDLTSFPVKDSICVLQGVRGRFAGTGEKVKVGQNANQTTWRIDVESGSSDPKHNVFGRVGCVEKSNFTSSNTSSWIGEKDFAVVTSGNAVEGLSIDDNNAAALQGISGKMEGGGEWGKLSFNSPINNEWALSTGSLQGTLYAYATIFGLDLPHPVSYSASAHEVKNHSATDHGRISDQLAPSDEAFCYLSRIDGNFDGLGEHIMVQRDTDLGYWKLVVDGACVQGFTGWGLWADDNPCEDTDHIKKLRAKAYCYKYDQQ